MKNIQTLIDKFISLGYEVRHRDNDRWVSLYKYFNNNLRLLKPNERLQIGRKLELYDNVLTITPYYRSGSNGSSSASARRKDYNYYYLGETKIICIDP